MFGRLKRINRKAKKRQGKLQPDTIESQKKTMAKKLKIKHVAAWYGSDNPVHKGFKTAQKDKE